MQSVQNLIPQSKPHPLKRKYRQAGLRLWQIQAFLGGSPSIGYLSMMLNCQTPMPEEIEAGIRNAIQIATASKETASA